jgi:hypothetical protein
MPFFRRRARDQHDTDERPPEIVDEHVINGEVQRKLERTLPVPEDDERVPRRKRRAVEEPDRQRRPPKRRKRRRPPPPPQQRGCLGTCALFAGLSVLVLTVAIACAFLAFMLDVADFVGDPIGNFLAVFGYEEDAEPEEVDSRTIVLDIRQMALLETTSSNIQITKTVRDTKWVPDAEMTVSYIGYVTVGIDLALIDEQDVVPNEDGMITITLPPAQITNCSLGKPAILHDECTHIWRVQDCGDIRRDLQDKAYDRSLDELRETAYEMDLIELAYQEAEAQIAALFGTVYPDQQLIFVPSDEVVPAPASCFPED